MTYYHLVTLLSSFEDAVANVRRALADEGFGVISEIDIHKTLEAKLGVQFRPYLILGACNPAMAYVALKLDDKIGALLPCNVVVQEREPGEIEVAIVDPAAAMAASDNPQLLDHARTVDGVLRRVADRLRRVA